MKRRHIASWSIVLLSLSVVILVWLQISHIIFSYRTATEIVERSIREAVNQTIITLQKQEIAIYIYDKYRNVDKSGSSFFDNTPLYNKISDEDKQIKKGKGTDRFAVLINSENIEATEAYYLAQFNNSKSELSRLTRQLEAEFMQKQVPVEKRFSVELITKLLKRNLNAFGIYLDFDFAILDDNTNEIKLSSSNFDVSNIDKSYKFNIDGGGFSEIPNLIAVYFPNKSSAIWEAIVTQVVVSFLVAIIFIIAFGVATSSIVKQKKINIVKNDFVNNMTHEFKTPIATIKLAATAIRSPQVVENKENVQKMCEVILQETGRMTQHVEQILQIASLDHNGLKLNLTDENPNTFIRDVISSIDLRVKQAGGEVIINTCESDRKIQFDTTLMTNVLLNLFDNAIKYTLNSPVIVVTTYFKNDRFFFSVKDNGIGMSKETQEHVFERFFRAHTGNVHNIKGFGLGLNYVKEIILAHKGFISVSSTEGKGSTFLVCLPITLKDKNYE